MGDYSARLKNNNVVSWCTSFVPELGHYGFFIEILWQSLQIINIKEAPSSQSVERNNTRV